MDKFNFKKYLTEHNLGSFGRFNGYVDMNPINEAETGKNITVDDFFSWFMGDKNWANDGVETASMHIDGKWADDFGGDDAVLAFLVKHKDDVLVDFEENQYADNGYYEMSFTIDGKKFDISDIANKYGETDLDEADQDMNITTKPSKIYASNDDWMNDNINGQRYDDWVAYWDDIPGIIIWTHNKINTENLYVAITPGWDGPGTPMETIFNAGDETGEYDSIEASEFNSFDEYLNAVKFYLDKIDDNIHAGKYKKYGVDLGPDTSNDKVYEAHEDEEVKLKDLNYNIVTTPWEFEKTWKDMYGEDFETEYSGAHSYLTKNYKNFNILDLGSVWERMYGEDFLENYPGIAKWLFSNEGRQSSKDKVVPKNDKIYEMGSDTLSQEEESGNSFGVTMYDNSFDPLSDIATRNAIKQFIKLVNTIGGSAVKIDQPDRETVNFKVTGVPSFEVLQNTMQEYTDNIDQRSVDYSALIRWEIEPNDEIGSDTLSQEEKGTIKEIDDEEGSALDLYREAENDFFSDPEVKAAIKTLNAKCAQYVNEYMSNLSDEEMGNFSDELYEYNKENDPDDFTYFNVAWYEQH